MTNTATSSPTAVLATAYPYVLRSIFAGILVPFGFAPFHFPGLAILGIALLFAELQGKSLKQSLLIGFIFGLSFMGLGVSWIFVSIHAYGHLNYIISALITCVFIAYTALFPTLTAVLYNLLAKTRVKLFACFLFSALWCIGEYWRATCFGGFPWLLIGFGQIDTPLKHLLPIIGVYGVGFLASLAATFLVNSIQKNKYKLYWLAAFIFILLGPKALQHVNWVNIEQKSISVGIIQANSSMREKWDEALFWKLLEHYQSEIDALLGKKQLIVMPESAIPVPQNYVSEWLGDLNLRAKRVGSTILMGIPKATNVYETDYYNTLTTIGVGHGSYLKQHLVPFGEYTPSPFLALTNWFNIPTSNMKEGNANQTLVSAQKYQIASLICYELAYPNLLRKQLPNAAWIVSISDDGWFGHSFAMHQQLQMAQVLSLQTGRYQIMANNDGLSSIIDTKGNLNATLPAFSTQTLSGTINPASGASPWVLIGDNPILYLSLCICLIAFLMKRRYPY